MSVASDTRLHSLDGVLDAAQSTDSDGDALDGLAADLFAVVDALESSVALRRAVTDPSTSSEGRQQLVHGLLDGRVSKPAVDIVAQGAAMRWAGGRTFTAALERQAVRAQLIKAERTGDLDNTEDELFRFARTVEGNPALRDALGGRAVPVAQRQDLVGELLAGRASEATVALAKRAVVARERTFAHTIEGFVTLAAAQKNRVVATVWVAQPLTDEQRDRLRAALSNQAGREVVLQEILDPDVVGGVRVELGDDVVEGTVAARLAAARRLFG
jgi:F-type H+-transporting ATPase subunit delta